MPAYRLVCPLWAYLGWLRGFPGPGIPFQGSHDLHVCPGLDDSGEADGSEPGVEEETMRFIALK